MNKDPVISCQSCNHTDKLSMFSCNGATIDGSLLSTEYQCPRCEGLFELETITEREE